MAFFCQFFEINNEYKITIKLQNRLLGARFMIKNKFIFVTMEDSLCFYNCNGKNIPTDPGLFKEMGACQNCILFKKCCKKYKKGKRCKDCPK